MEESEESSVEGLNRGNLATISTGFTPKYCYLFNVVVQNLHFASFRMTSPFRSVSAICVGNPAMLMRVKKLRLPFFLLTNEILVWKLFCSFILLVARCKGARWKVWHVCCQASGE